MRKSNKYLAATMAAALMVNPCTVSQPMHEVQAEEMKSEETVILQETESFQTAEKSENAVGTEKIESKENHEQQEKQMAAEESGESQETVAVTGVSAAKGTDVTALKTPTKFNVEVQVKAPEDTGIREVQLYYGCTGTDKNILFTKTYEENQLWYPGEAGEACEVEVELNEYTGTGEYILQSVSVYTRDKCTDYYYDEEKKEFMLSGQDGEVLPGFAYGGEADYTVAESEKEDTSYPRVTSVERVTSGDIYSNTMIQYKVGYEEEGSGIKRIGLVFARGGWGELGGEELEYSGEILDSGTGTIIISSEHEWTPGFYGLDEILIEDNSGNFRSYKQEGMVWDFVATDQNGEEIDRLQFLEDQVSHVVQTAPYDGIRLKGFKFAADIEKDKLSAGDVFDVIATVANDTEEEQTVNPAACKITWSNQDSGALYEIAGQGDSYQLAPGKESEILFRVSVNPYAETGERQLQEVILSSQENGEGIGYYNSNDGKLTGYLYPAEDRMAIVESIDYDTEINYTVAASEKPDEEAPYIEGISVTTKDIKAPGTVSFDIHVPDEGFAKMQEIYFELAEKENEKNKLWFDTAFSRGTFSYSEEKKCYVFETELEPYTTKGTYKLTEIMISDEAGNIRSYLIDESGKLVDAGNAKNILTPCEMTVISAECEDYDFDVPVLKNITLIDGNVKNGGEVQFKIDAEDESELAFVNAFYRNKETGEKTELQLQGLQKETDGYLCNFTVDKYCESGEYELSEIYLFDGSERGNTVGYSYDPDTLTLHSYDAGMEEADDLVLKKDVGLKVTQSEDLVVVDIGKDDVKKAVESIQKGGTIAIKDSYLGSDESRNLPKEVFEKAKEKELTIVVLDESYTAELMIEGDKIDAVPDKDVKLQVQRDSMVKEEITVGDFKDNLYYPVDVVVSDTKIPFTLRVKLDDEFQELHGKRPVRFSQVGADGTITIIKDHLKADEDGYLRIDFKDGIGTPDSSQSKLAKEGAEDTGNTQTRFIVSSQVAELIPGSGDIDGDGEVTLLDLMACLNHVAKKKELTGDALRAADIDGKDGVKLADLMRILNYVSKKSDKL